MLGLAVIALAAQGGGEPGEHWEKSTETYFEKVGKAARVVVENPHGNIWVRFGVYDDQVELIATAQRLEPEFPSSSAATGPPYKRCASFRDGMRRHNEFYRA